MANYRPDMWFLKPVVIVCAFAMLSFAFGTQVGAQSTDLNAPYKDAYDALTRDRPLVGSWQGTISGSSISQADGQMAGQAVFVNRGYEDSNNFGIVLHDHRHRDGLEYSQISISSIPCGPEGGAIRAINPIEKAGAPAGTYAGVNFLNKLADTGRSDFEVGVGGGYFAELVNPATIITRWSDDSFTLRLSGPFKSMVAPVRNHTFDYERQRQTYLDHIHLDVEFTLPRGSENFERTLCKEREIFDVVRTRPENSRQNVILDGADFYIEFTDELVESSVNTGTVFMTTRDRNNGYVFVDLDLSLEDENGVEDKTMIRIEPREPLLSGTIYEIRVVGGEDGIRGYDSEFLEEDHIFAVSTMVDPDNLRMGIYQVSRNAPLVLGKPAAARIHFEWEELEEIHPEWQVLAYDLKAEILDSRDNTIFPEIRKNIERTDQYTDEDRRLGIDTLNLFDWSPSRGNDPRVFRAEIRPEDHYPEDVEVDPEIVEKGMDYAAQSVDLLTFDYYIAAHSEWRDNIDIQQSRQVVQAAQQDREFANQILPVAKVSGRFRGTYNLQDTICTIPGVEWVVCQEGFISWDNPANRAANLNKWDTLVRLFHEHVAARSNADILVSYHPPSLGGAGTTRAPFEQPESLRRSGDEPYWFGEPDPELLDMLHADRTDRSMVIMSTAAPKNRIFPGILLYPLVAHEFGHVFGLPHTPYAEGAQHKREICQSQFQTVAPGIDGMRIALDGSFGWQKSSEHGNAQTPAPLLKPDVPVRLRTAQ
ncbi:hypothetical protein [Qingshengfaniella alkalisoli]|uniref:SbsA Ig-like domain-containing protein n=1 Tax=Qingshengfaniella alkalisoli TaxID=2599296 RepID=A0A5B8JAC8_9RHOB|nr:hypothetical protein [Qingshengfaniella alkalisoli]QDY71150.1 hypothetical protein FPZ52_15715 [Qingshengfaniella alkalisoli]